MSLKQTTPLPQLILIEIRLHCFTLDYLSLAMAKSSWLLITQTIIWEVVTKDRNRSQKYGNKEIVFINVGEFSKENSGVRFSG